jgi:superfamily II DNA or RNA helicase
MRLPDGNRAGYFAGDGTGVGKSRMGAGIALDNWNQGRRRILMLSVNYDLLPSTKEALAALGASIPVKSMNRIKSGAPIDMAERAGKNTKGQPAGKDGVLFASYATLIKEPRFAAIVDWLGKDGVIIFDEAHRAKNATGVGTRQSLADGTAGSRTAVRRPVLT